MALFSKEISFIFFILLFLAIGIISIFKSKKTTEDYLLAGRNVSPWLVSLSAVATNNSGFMFIGLTGMVYMIGISASWMMIGWIVGDFISSFFVHRQLRTYSQRTDSLTFSEILTRWDGNQNFKHLRTISSIVILIFLGAYAATQLSAGSKALHVVFGLNYELGILIGGFIVLIYSFSGGIRASIWTDAIQSFVMLSAILLIVVIATLELGGISKTFHALSEIPDGFLNPFLNTLPLPNAMGFILFVVGWLFAGFGVIAQPHIMIRFMAMNKPADLPRIRFYYYGFYVLFSFACIVSGLLARLILNIPFTDFDSELAFPMLADQLLPEPLIGFMIAGIFAATISTADSQILSCSGSITNDLPFERLKSSYYTAKFATLFVTFIAVSIALLGNQSVFILQVLSWSALSSSFAPLLFIYTLGRRPNEITAILMATIGLGASLLFAFTGWNIYIHESMVGIIAGLSVYLISYFLYENRSPSKSLTVESD